MLGLPPLGAPSHPAHHVVHLLAVTCPTPLPSPPHLTQYTDSVDNEEAVLDFTNLLLQNESYRDQLEKRHRYIHEELHALHSEPSGYSLIFNGTNPNNNLDIGSEHPRREL